jgi:hypothetical protein
MYAAAGQAIRQARKGKKSSGSTGPSRQQSQALLVPSLLADNISVRNLRVASAVEVHFLDFPFFKLPCWKCKWWIFKLQIEQIYLESSFEMSARGNISSAHILGFEEWTRSRLLHVYSVEWEAVSNEKYSCNNIISLFHQSISFSKPETNLHIHAAHWEKNQKARVGEM